MARKRRRSRRSTEDLDYELVDEQLEDEEERSSRRHRSHRRPPRRRWLRRLFLLVLLLATLAAAAPTIVCRTSLRSVALDYVSDAVGLEFEARQISAGWLSATKAEDVVVRDREGRPLLTAAALRIDRSLLRLLRNRQDLGTLRLDQPTAVVTVDEQGSNWQRALAPLLQRPAGGPSPRIRLQVVEGVVEVKDKRAMRSWNIGPLELAAAFDEQAQSPIEGELTTLLSDDRGLTGRLQLSIAADDKSLSSGQSRIVAEQLSLSLVQSLAAGLAPGLQLHGQLDTSSRLTWRRGAAPQAQLQINSLQVSQLMAVSPQLPPGDSIVASQLTGAGSLRWEAGRLHADRLQLNSDVANLTAQGQIDLRRTGGAAPQQLGPDDTLQLTADVNLARLAAMMPQTLRIRRDTAVDSGSLSAAVNSRMEQGGRVWRATFDASQLAATTAGRRIQWNQPVSVVVDAVRQNAGWSVRRLDCAASFVKLQGSGDLARGRVDVEANLDQLRNELSQLIDLGAARLAGSADGFLAWQQGARGLQSNGRLDLKQFEVALPGRAPLAEPQLAVVFSAQGRTNDTTITHVEQAQLTVSAAGDQMVAELLQPVARGRQPASYPLSLQLKGDLGRWLMRAAVLGGNPRLNGDGAVDFNGTVDVSPQQLVIRQSQLEAAPCRVHGLGVVIDEPQLQSSIVGTYHWDTGRWAGGPSTLVSATLAVRCDNLLYEPTAEGGRLSGDIAYRGNLDRFLKMLAVTDPGRQQYLGQFNGQLRLVQQQGTTRFTVQQRLEDFVVRQRDAAEVQTVSTGGWRESWKEDFIDVNGSGAYVPQQDLLTLDQLTAEAHSVQLNVAGRIADLSRRMNADLAGQLKYDLQRLTTKLQPLTGSSIVLQGVSQKPIAIRGPLRQPSDWAQVAASQRPLLPIDLLANAGFAWDAAVIDGFRIGPGEIRTSLEQGVVRFDAMQIPVSQGRLLLAPQVDFRTASPILTQPAGPVVENLTISPEMCRTWLKYVAPLLADTTRVQGRFSASIDQVAVPLTNPRGGTIRGVMNIHGAQAGPGPLAQQLLGFIRQTETAVKAAKQGGQVSLDRALDLLSNGSLVGPDGRIDPRRALGGLLGGAATTASPAASQQWLVIPEHQLNFHVAENRVHHRNMRLRIDDVEIRTTGSVGFDNTLALVAELPVPDKWLGSSPAVASLRGKVLQIPIRGTVRQPQIDGSLFRQLTGQLLSGAAAGAVNRITPQPAGTAPGAAAPNPAATAPNPVNDALNRAAEDAGQEIDRTLRKLFGK